MKASVFRTACLALFSAASAASLFGSFGTPDWVYELARIATPRNVGNASAVVLLDDTFMDVDEQGTATTTHRVAVRILAAPGKEMASARVYYLKNADKVRTTDAWLIREKDAVKPPKYLDWIDVSSDPYGALYSDIRYKYISRSEDAVAGDVFVAETKVTGPLLEADTTYVWGWNGLPVLNETFRVKVPAGFSLKPSLHGKNQPIASSAADGREIAWSFKDQSYVRAETYTTRRDLTEPVLLLRIDPPPGANRFRPVVLHSWSDFAGWMQTLNSAQCDTSSQLADKSRQLIATCTTPIAKIRALGTYVQSLRYVAFDAGLSKGLGYQARKASEVFGHGYGDCKDKANLLCAMLREAGIDAHVAAARSGDDLPVWLDFPSAGQFDHAIAAIQVDDSVDLPAIVKTPKGRLLFFDPTAEHTLVGDLPWYLQGTSVCVQADGSSSLISLPVIPADTGHVYVRQVVLKLQPDGSCTGKVSFLGRGQAGAELRSDLFKASTDEALRNFAADLLGDSVRGAQLKGIERKDDPVTGLCGVTFEFSKLHYLQFFKNSLAVAKGEILSRGPVPALTTAERHSPVKLRALAFDDQIELDLPAALKTEELPAPLSFSSPFGHYARTFKAEGNTIKLARRLELDQQIVPVADYPALRKFLSDLGRADRASILLRTGPDA